MSRPVRVTELKRQLAESIAAIDALDNLTDESLRTQQQTTESTLQLQQLQKARVSSSEKFKIHDLSKLVEKLIQLRNIRRKKLEAKGHFFPEEGNEFFEKIKAWNAEHEEGEQILERDRSKDTPLFVHPDDHWEQEPLDTTAYGHWSQGFQEIDSLRRVRNQWDYYLDDGPNESIEAKVPPTWVPPAPPSNWIWATCLTHQPQQHL
ncbi:hypothetical protein BJV82DRAFT_577297 [Fennellomyces sp. T-0311]|nr:hypothetical protein BJV82DRAFT_577297 [Fennellomyces sp. T-0311]